MDLVQQFEANRVQCLEAKSRSTPDSTDFHCNICVKDRTVRTPPKSSVIRDLSRSMAQSTAD